MEEKSESNVEVSSGWWGDAGDYSSLSASLLRRIETKIKSSFHTFTIAICFQSLFLYSFFFCHLYSLLKYIQTTLFSYTILLIGDISVPTPFFMFRNDWNTVSSECSTFSTTRHLGNIWWFDFFRFQPTKVIDQKSAHGYENSHLREYSMCNREI